MSSVLLSVEFPQGRNHKKDWVQLPVTDGVMSTEAFDP